MKALRPSPAFSTKRSCLIAFAVVWLVFTCFPSIVLAAVATSAREIEFAGIGLGVGLIWLIFQVPFVAVGVGLLVWGLSPYVARLKVSTPKLSVSSDTLRIGETFSVGYEQAFKRLVDVKRASLQLLLRESATYRRGTDTHTDTHDRVVQQFALPSRQYQAGERLHDRRQFQIPEDGMHTFRAPDNKLEWVIRVQVEVAGWPDMTEEFSLTVLPERIA